MSAARALAASPADPQSPAAAAEQLTVALPGELVDVVAARVVEMLEERGMVEPDPWLTVEQAAEYIGAKKQRLYDLVDQGKLWPGRDGRRLLFRRSDLDAYLEGRST